MPAKTFLPRTINGRIKWLRLFAAELPNYAEKYNLTSAQIADVQGGIAFLLAWKEYETEVKIHYKEVNAFFKEMLYGVRNSAAGNMLLPALAAAPTLQAPVPGILSRAVAIGKGIKTQSGYTAGDGVGLGIVGPESKTDLQTMQPALLLRLVQGGHPEICWKKHGLDGIQIYKDSGNGVFSLLAYAAHPNTIDNAPLPADGFSAIWKYKAIYMHNDMQVGQWSNVVSIAVTGALG